MTDTVVANLEIKAAEAAKRNEEMFETVKAVKESNDSLVNEMKGVFNTLNETLNVIKENEEKKSAEALEVKALNNVVITEKKDDLAQFENEVKEASTKILLHTANEKEKSMFKSDSFKDYLKEKAMQLTFGDLSKSNSLVDDAIQRYQIACDSNSLVVPIIMEKKDGIYRESVGADGGYVAKPSAIGALEEIWDKYQITINDLANHVTTNSSEYLHPLEFQGVKCYWEGEERREAEKSKTDYNQVEIKVSEITAEGMITRKMVEDSAIDLYDRFMINAREAIKEAKEKAFYNGTGEINSPKGLFSSHYSLIDSDAKFKKDAFRKYSFTSTSNNSLDTDLKLVLDAIEECILMTEKHIKKQAIFMHPKTYFKIMQLVAADGRYLVDRTMPREMNGIRMLFGLPVITSTEIPSIIGANNQVLKSSKGIFIGNMNEVYTVVDRLSLVSWMNVITDPKYIHFFVRERVGGGATGFNKGSFIVEE